MSSCSSGMLQSLSGSFKKVAREGGVNFQRPGFPLTKLFEFGRPGLNFRYWKKPLVQGIKREAQSAKSAKSSNFSISHVTLAVRSSLRFFLQTYSLSHIVNIFINLLAAWPSGPVLEQSVRSSATQCVEDPSIYVFL